MCPTAPAQAGSSAAIRVEGEESVFLRRIWQSEDGLPNPVVRAVRQTRDGYLWVATDETLSRFDGVRFVEFDRKNLREKNDRWMVGLSEAKDGSIWVSACNGGILHIRDELVERFTTEHGLPDNYVLSTCVDSKGNLWVGTAKGLAKFDNDRFLSLTNEPGLLVEAVRHVMEDSQGSIWIGTAIGLSRFKDGQFTSYTTNNLLAQNAIYYLHEGRDGALWIGTSAGISRYKDGRLKHYTDKDGMAHGTVRSIHEDKSGRLWIGTHGGLQQLINGKFRHVSFRDTVSFESGDFISDIVYGMWEDREGNLWAGSNIGLYRFKQQHLHTITTDDGLGHNQVTSVLEDSSGALWIGTLGGGITRFQGEEKTTFTRDHGLGNNLVLSIYEDKLSRIWVGSDGGGVARFEDGRFIRYRIESSEPGAHIIRAFCEDGDGVLWAGGNAGIFKFDGDKYIHVSLPQAVVSSVKTLYSDRMGRLWIGARGGLVLWGEEELVVYDQRQGLPADQVNAIYEDASGVFWIGTELGGLSRFKDGKFISFKTPEGPFEERVMHILEGNSGNLWMATRNGIFAANKVHLNNYAEGRSDSVSFLSYGRADGLRRAQCNGIGQPAGWKASDGRLWFAMMHGAAVFAPEELKSNRVPPPVSIERVLVDGKPFPGWREGKFPPGQGQIEFHYTGLSFNVPEKVQFRHKLEGFDREWQDVGKRREARYTNLRPGNYTFVVQAANNDGVWNETGASLKFSLAPRFYQTYAFYAGCSIAVFLLAVGGWRLRVGQLRRRELELMALVNDRTKELQQEVNDREQAERRATVLSKLGQRLSLAASQEAAADIIADAANELLGWDACSVYSYNAEENKGRPLVIYNVINGNRTNVLSAYGNTDFTSVLSRAAQNGAQIVLREDAAASRNEGARDGDASKAPSMMYVPIRKGETVVGVVSVQSRKVRAYDNHDLGTLQALADYCGGAFDRIRAEEALRQSQQMVMRQERLAAVGQLSAGVAHEFNNILTVIKGHSNLLMDSSEIAEDARQSLAQISLSAERAANLTRQMLAFSRKQIMQPKAVNLNEVTAQVTKMLGRLLGENISVCCNAAPNLPSILADVAMMEQIIMNLALNARDAMPNGGQLIISSAAVQIDESQIEGRAEAYPGHFVCLTVSDTGSGMDEATVQRIFEPFFTTKEVGKGTGLGLATVYGIIKQHRGWIEVASQPGRGTAFSIYLPVASEQAAKSTQPMPSAPVSGGKETILFVEDETDIRRLVRVILERYGYRVLEAETGVEALKVWKEHKDSIQLLLTDMVMPEGVSGKDLANQLRAENPKLKVIFSSGYSVEMLEKDFADQPGLYFLPKPYQPQKLGQVVRECLDAKN